MIFLALTTTQMLIILYMCCKYASCAIHIFLLCRLKINHMIKIQIMPLSRACSLSCEPLGDPQIDLFNILQYILQRHCKQSASFYFYLGGNPLENVFRGYPIPVQYPPIASST
jgi:hypothetical protein